MNATSKIRMVSSMATRHVLAELISRFEAASPLPVELVSIGGVDAAKRVKAGEAFDVVVLAANVIDDLIAAGHLVAGSRVDLVTSPVALAVRAGASHPDISSAEGVKRAVLAARTVGYSTGPSGTYLAQLFAGWDPTGDIKSRIVIAPPGVPVATLVARGDVELGFQQLSELLGVDGIDVVGMLPAAIQMVTTFSGGVGSAATHPDAARGLLAFMASPAATEIKERFGMGAAA